MAAADDSLYPIAVLIDELRNEDVQVGIVVIVQLCLSLLRSKICNINRCELIS